MSCPPTISTYRPTKICGRFFQTIIGENSLWEVSSVSINIEQYLPRPLSPVSPVSWNVYLKYHSPLSRYVCRKGRKIQVQDQCVVQSTDEQRGMIINYGLLKDWKYSFVLIGDGRLIFTRIPRTKLKIPYQLLSKHVVLAKRSSDVRFAGEMRIIDGEKTLLINNNSGTYQPEEQLIPSAVNFFQDLFPYLIVQSAHRNLSL